MYLDMYYQEYTKKCKLLQLDPKRRAENEFTYIQHTYNL